MASKRRQEFKQSVCFSCKKSIDLNVMGDSALVSHMKGKKHEEYVKNLQGNEKTTKIGDFFSGAPAREARVGQSTIFIEYGQLLFVWLSRD